MKLIAIPENLERVRARTPAVLYEIFTTLTTQPTDKEWRFPHELSRLHDLRSVGSKKNLAITIFPHDGMFIYKRLLLFGSPATPSSPSPTSALSTCVSCHIRHKVCTAALWDRVPSFPSKSQRIIMTVSNVCCSQAKRDKKKFSFPTAGLSHRWLYKSG